MTNEPQEETMDQTEQTQEKLSIDDLHPKMELEGTVTKVELFGAFVDIGVGRDGLVHISQLQEGRVNRVEDVVKPGDTVTVWVNKVEPKVGRIDLTMIEPPGIGWSELRKGQTYTGRVVRIEKFGVFVDIGAERPGLVHISEMARGYVGDPGDVVAMGDEIEVKLIDFDKRKKRIDLSMKDSTAPEPVQEAEAEEERLPTAMELAMRAAMSGRNAREADRRKSGEDRRRVQRAQQEDILTRTLRQRSK